MPKRALVEQRPWLLASVAFAISYYFVRDGAVPGTYLIAWKGVGVALLAVYVRFRGTGTDGKILAAVLAFGAAGDIAIQLSLQAGAAFFFVGHLIAIALYLRHRRPRLTQSHKSAAAALVLAAPLIAFFFPADRSAAPAIALYALALGGMMAAAWWSAFRATASGWARFCSSPPTC